MLKKKITKERTSNYYKTGLEVTHVSSVLHSVLHRRRWTMPLRLVPSSCKFIQCKVQSSSKNLACSMSSIIASWWENDLFAPLVVFVAVLHLTTGTGSKPGQPVAPSWILETEKWRLMSGWCPKLVKILPSGFLTLKVMTLCFKGPYGYCIYQMETMHLGVVTCSKWLSSTYFILFFRYSPTYSPVKPIFSWKKWF